MTESPHMEVPPCIQWTAEEVADWIGLEIGFPYYRECFEKNFITGRKLVLLRASHLPKMGITFFEDIKTITAAIRKLLNTKLIEPSRNISFLPREPWAMYLEEHSQTSISKKPSYLDFLRIQNMKHDDP